MIQYYIVIFKRKVFMGKRNSTWVSPKKQKIIDEQNRRAFRRKLILAIVGGVVLAALLALGIFGIVMASRPYYAYIEIDGYGTIVIELNDDEAPKTVDAFVELAESGHYNGTSIHTAMKNSYMMGGKRDGVTVDPIKGEFAKNGVDNSLSIFRGTIVMARVVGTDASDSSNFDKATGEFFIVQRDKPEWDGYYAAFGTVVEGMEIVDAICDNVSADEDGDIIGEQPIIVSIRIEREYK